MTDTDIDLDDIERRMQGAVDSLKSELAGLRAGRANVSMLDPVTVTVYGSNMPLNQVGTVSVPEPRMLSVQVWDKGNASAVEKAIRSAGLGLNPMMDGGLVRVPIPELNEERRAEMSKVAGKYAEQARISARNVRRDGIDTAKKLEKSSAISEDDLRLYSDEIQTLTDKYIKKIDDVLQAKEKEIMQV